MVQKSKGGNKSRSVISGKRKKQAMTHHRKTNYKVKRLDQIECCICYEMIPDLSDNTITCGKTNHPLCSDCKIKVNKFGSENGSGNDCPMCRSHNIPLPKSQEVEIRVMKAKVEKEGSPKKIRIEGSYDPFIDGIYEEMRKDRDRISVYMNCRGSYLYRSDGKFRDWVINGSYMPKSKLAMAWSCGKLLGTSQWQISDQPNDIWKSITIRITPATSDSYDDY